MKGKYGCTMYNIGGLQNGVYIIEEDSILNNVGHDSWYLNQLERNKKGRPLFGNLEIPEIGWGGLGGGSILKRWNGNKFFFLEFL